MQVLHHPYFIFRSFLGLFCFFFCFLTVHAFFCALCCKVLVIITFMMVITFKSGTEISKLFITGLNFAGFYDLPATIRISIRLNERLHNVG